MTLKLFLFLFFCGWLSSPILLAQTVHLKVEGATAAETKIIAALNYQSSFDNYQALQNELQVLQKKLHASGYLESDIVTIQQQPKTYFLATFNLGTIYTTARIYFNAEFNTSHLKLVSTAITNTYFEVDVSTLESALQRLNSEIIARGDPFSTLQLTNIKTEDGLLTAQLQVDQNDTRKIDAIIVKGYEKFPKSFIKQYLKLKPKQVFNLKAITLKTERLENLEFATQLKAPEVLFTKDSTLLYIYVDKQKSNTFDGFIGFGTNTETNKLELDGYLNLNLTNSFNYGESFRILYKSDENDQKTFDVKVKLPYLFGSLIGTQFGLNIFKKDSSFITTSQFAKINYQINPNNTLALGINTINSATLLEAPILNTTDFRSRFYDLSYVYTIPQLQDKLFPIQFLFEVSAGLGHRILENSQTTQTKIELNTFNIFTLNARNSIFGRLNGALLNSDLFLNNELFRFGGINSIRGFAEQSLMANRYAVLNTEYRYKVTNTLYVNSIVDVAYYENQNSTTKDNLLGLGIGFGVLTQAGLFKLNYSNGSSKQQSIKLSDSKVHLSLSATF
ncbi:hypothetical protein MWU76_13570 [Gelidibacter sp. F2691]|nr:hypothetical protein [Gelidibacter sp. F2691]